ncbi:MAG: ChrR family anti-sigma-E factor [Candidatus Thiodiazotropha endolucinida]|nr:ChrR family anti-sigma-E factor [Candidatus Thiodiazotropha taylori]MCG8064967.1 ChrR family anti-sigma-E factor [Candidatus Thiodiazotropha taylori]MCG8092683.1 ChrR family anti-sigma-E factor [Candidatus Thiodiazotropha endolucinida]MCW4331058.1 ChrR family anti-sigma-E factor [Candidatus Thiodiazotropha endolucinida]MCW4345030.1 ChrR family anti-sigma-E factor [Candidatus Thiodiazotropha endolucinida]
MNIKHHPDDATILAYAAGAVTEGFSLVLAAHMESCPHCCGRMAEANALGGELLSEMQPAAMSASGLEDVWSRIDSGPDKEFPVATPNAPVDGVPGILIPYLPDGIDSLQWRSLVPGIRQHVINGVESGRGSVRLLSIAPGTTIPHHTHLGGELTLVIKGAYTDEMGCFQCGDLADLDASVSHQPVAESGEPCICLIATDDRLRFSGVFSRMLQPLIGI